jgi:hypothetical protein
MRRGSGAQARPGRVENRLGIPRSRNYGTWNSVFVKCSCAAGARAKKTAPNDCPKGAGRRSRLLLITLGRCAARQPFNSRSRDSSRDSRGEDSTCDICMDSHCAVLLLDARWLGSTRCADALSGRSCLTWTSSGVCCKHETMPASIPVNAKGRGGRPPGKEFPVSVQIRLTEAQAASLDAWREVQPEKPSRSEAIRRLLTAALDPKA